MMATKPKPYTVLDVVVSRETGERYEIRRGGDGVTYCQCKGWQFRKTCKHLTRWKAVTGATGGARSVSAPSLGQPRHVQPVPTLRDRLTAAARRIDGLVGTPLTRAEVQTLAALLREAAQQTTAPAVVADSSTLGSITAATRTARVIYLED